MSTHEPANELQRLLQIYAEGPSIGCEDLFDIYETLTIKGADTSKFIAFIAAKNPLAQYFNDKFKYWNERYSIDQQAAIAAIQDVAGDIDEADSRLSKLHAAVTTPATSPSTPADPPSVVMKRRFKTQRIITLALLTTCLNLAAPTAGAYPMEEDNMGMDLMEEPTVSLEDWISGSLHHMFNNATQEYQGLGVADFVTAVVNGLHREYPDNPHPPPPHDCGPHDKDLDPIGDTYDEVPYPPEEDPEEDGSEEDDASEDDDDVTRNSLIYACIEQSLVYPIDSAAAQIDRTMTDSDRGYLRRSFNKMCAILENVRLPNSLDRIQGPPIVDPLTIESFANCSLRDDGDIEQEFVNIVRSPTTICKLLCDLFGLC